MSGKGSFENQFDDFSSNSASHILNETCDAVSQTLYKILENYKSEKLTFFLTEPNKNIFHHDWTVYTGSAGLALFYLQSSLAISGGKGEKRLKKPPSHPCLQIENILMHSICLNFFQMKALKNVELNSLKGKRISFLCGDAGPLAIATVISYKLGNRRPDFLPQYENLAQRLMNLISLLNESPDELLYGKAGYLFALLFVNKYVGGNGKDLIPASHIEKIIASILKSGKEFAQQMKSKCPLLWQWHDKIYLGAAHGVAGILYMLLQARSYIEANDLRDLVKPTVDWLLNQKFPSGNFPSSLGSASGDRLVQWCHGAPGFVPLCLLSYQVFKEEKYLKVAIQCGDVIWQRGICTKGYSLCHGVSGNAYAFLQLYQVTKNPQCLYRACCFMEWCISERPGTEMHRPDRPASLFEGLLGRIQLAEDIMNALESKFPAYCV